jgi:hypothetical protein
MPFATAETLGGVGLVAVDLPGGGAGHDGDGLAAVGDVKWSLSAVTVTVLLAWIMPTCIFCLATMMLVRLAGFEPATRC